MASFSCCSLLSKSISHAGLTTKGGLFFLFFILSPASARASTQHESVGSCTAGRMEHSNEQPRTIIMRTTHPNWVGNQARHSKHHINIRILHKTTKTRGSYETRFLASTLYLALEPGCEIFVLPWPFGSVDSQRRKKLAACLAPAPSPRPLGPVWRDGHAARSARSKLVGV